MSDSITKEETAKAEVSKPEQNEYVSKKAYEEVSADLHKFKKAKKDLLAQVNELKARFEAEEKAKMEEKQQFEELYKKAEAEKSSLLQQIEQERTQLLNQRRKAALKQELGNIKDVYLNLAEINSIEVNEDGTLNSESVRSVANAFKQEHSALIPSGNSGTITSQAAPIDTASNSNVSVDDLDYDEALKRYMELKRN